ncbi:NAD/NADP-dependent octopine/nopaline dehydrogenase family protein [Roseomonas sp. AR75]|uniref:NAD/NADP-dependent octopine/nopaline dehydrogenase family protein n=1 Tax=Roseomonas sp. AR75 TaxID=2562311 RepID=UPI0010BFAEF3|nr:NAD/NADP-dependent octopine/nopaline dehydrogenase family protein [Roseomonas sp. AR75]
MRLAVLGAGAIGPAAAVLAVSRGHQAVLWSPSGAGTAGIDGALHAEGVLEGRFPVAVAATLEDAFRGADAALLAVPAYAFADVLPRIAAALPADLPLLISPAASLAPLVLDALRARQGAPARRAPIGAMATTTGGARRLGPDRVRVAMLRKAVDMAAVPAAAAEEMAALAHALFGADFPLSPDALHASLINVNPIAHSVLALTNVTRMERGEDWPQYAMMTPFACNLMQRMAEERDALAAAYGHSLDGLDVFFARANPVAMGPLPVMTAAIAAARPGVRGPATTDTRYVTEDVPFGLAYYLAIAAPRGVAMPVTAAMIRMLEALWDRDLRDNPMLAALDLAALPRLLRDGARRS